MKPEEKAREKIDHLLEAAGWTMQNMQELNLGSSLGVAVRSFPLKSGEADYWLFVDRKAEKLEKAKEIFRTDKPTEKQVKQASEELAKIACTPFDNPKLRNTVIEIKKRNEQIFGQELDSILEEMNEVLVA